MANTAPLFYHLLKARILADGFEIPCQLYVANGGFQELTYETATILISEAEDAEIVDEVRCENTTRGHLFILEQVVPITKEQYDFLAEHANKV